MSFLTQFLLLSRLGNWHKVDASLCPLEAVFGNNLDNLTDTPLLGHFHVSCTFFFTHHNNNIIVVVLCVKLHKALGNYFLFEEQKIILSKKFIKIRCTTKNFFFFQTLSMPCKSLKTNIYPMI